MTEVLPKFSISDLLLENVDSSRAVPFVKFLPEQSVLDISNKFDLVDAIMQMSELHSKLAYQLDGVKREKASMHVKLNEILQQLRMLKVVEAKHEVADPEPIKYALSNDLHAEAVPEYDGNVSLWLGANVMIEMNYVEAKEFLNKQQTQAQTGVERTDCELEHIRKQMVNCELNMSRLKVSSLQAPHADDLRRTQEQVKDLIAECTDIHIHLMHRWYFSLFSQLVACMNLWRQLCHNTPST